MNQVAFLVCLAGLVLLPILVLGVRLVRPRLMPWWAAFLTAVGLGWALLVVGAMLRETPEGGAGHVGALFFGWALALVWFAPWLLVYAIIQRVRGSKMLAVNSSPAKP